ncbi:diaminopimelate epimerase [Methylocapsa polymorpha]|uniref:Diaminopimelate epimerase n=1 Tax=Methylocapsa polymorpha TaxID=3080828 RepID=A0ABZ0HWD2_9HYPH|nr:diaminopimelate epimerase [Methylocapsa sp. RX1]
MSALANRLVTKMNGLGNEIVVLDLRGGDVVVSGPEARAIGQGEGLAFDQLMVLQDPISQGADAFVTIFNSDGSQAGACGNGARCVAWTLARDAKRKELTLETATARLQCRRLDDWIFAVEMGRPRLAWDEIPLRDPVDDTRSIDLAVGPPDAPILSGPSVVNMGNPHAIFWVADIEAYDLAAIGPRVENDPVFPDRVNVSLGRVISREHIALKTWERGAGLTRACGSAACAALVAAARKNLTGRAATVTLPGGDLDIAWRESDDIVVMTGPVEFEFETRLDPALFADMAT